MSLSGSRLTSALSADRLTQLQAAFPVPAALLTAEKTAYNAAQAALANALSNADGPDIVAEITGHAIVNPNTLAVVPSAIVAPVGGGSCSGSGVVTVGTGTVS